MLNKKMTLNLINENLEVEDIKFGMLEQDAIQRWGSGEYIHGFGGHGREYEDKKIRLSFPGDMDNDLYGKIGSLEFSNPDFSIFTVTIGDNREIGIEELLSNGFRVADYSQDIFVNGEFSIALRGKSKIEYIQIWFMDKDLIDRNY